MKNGHIVTDTQAQAGKSMAAENWFDSTLPPCGLTETRPRYELFALTREGIQRSLELLVDRNSESRMSSSELAV